ncbi:hypothetical protein, partial [Brachyspira sp. G79]|uniref:hypothetical protein n=1 Tax=Brachyspira sp. G79 TaxID=1358104 RepID=UPI00196A6052
NISMLNKDVLKIENDFNTVIENIKDYDNYVYDFVSKDNFIPKEIYSNAFNLRNIIKNIYDHIIFEYHMNEKAKNNDYTFTEDMSKNIDLKIDENIIKDIENKISVNDIDSSLEHIISNKEKFNKLLNSINDINKNDINLHNYTDYIYNNIKYKLDSNMFFNEEEIEKINEYESKEERKRERRREIARRKEEKREIGREAKRIREREIREEKNQIK